jgi:hypothetical protein
MKASENKIQKSHNVGKKKKGWNKYLEKWEEKKFKFEKDNE